MNTRVCWAGNWGLCTSSSYSESECLDIFKEDRSGPERGRYLLQVTQQVSGEVSGSVTLAPSLKQVTSLIHCCGSIQKP